MTKEQIIEYLYENNVRGDFTIEQMAEDLADRKTEPSGYKTKPVEDEPQITMDCSKCERYKDGGELCDFCAIKDEPQTERSEK